MKLSTILLIGAAGYIGFTLRKKKQAQAAAAASAAATPAPPQPIMDTSTTVTSIQRTVNDPGTNSDSPSLDDQSYAAAGSSGSLTQWVPGGSRASGGWGTYR